AVSQTGVTPTTGHHKWPVKILFLNHHAAVPVLFCTIHGAVGGPQKRFEIRAVSGKECDADGSGAGNLPAFEIEGLSKQIRSAREYTIRINRPERIIDTNNELIATDTTADIGVPYAGAEPFGDFAQKFITHNMAVGIVHALEVVEIDERQRQPSFKASLRKPVFNQRLGEAAIGQTSQIVVVCLEIELIFTRLKVLDTLFQLRLLAIAFMQHLRHACTAEQGSD